MRIRTKILLILSLMWMVFIFFMSAQSSKTSAQISDGITAVVVDVMYGDQKAHIDDEDDWVKSVPSVADNIERGLVPKNDIFGRNRFFFKNDLRKLAHIILYFVLGVTVNLTFLSHFGKNRIYHVALCFVICTVYAVTDELHQMLVPGRSAQLMDVGIDCIGVLAGIALVAGVCAVIRLVKSTKA